ncbi:hypothetical protein [Leuconostoc lactis]|uniref:hypothetical protein n=1 Tax=Leuconostoc lactis TaxID=1246 RepID=UPI0011BB8053|nr:hypothetical protein [Leuconostoc lactis]QEA50863.1 hypothetical protein FGL78_04150 [Leuconostoc lactis]
MKLNDDVTIAEVAKQIEYFSDRVRKIEEIGKDDYRQAFVEFTSFLKEFKLEEHMFLNSMHKERIETNPALRAYRGYFSHIKLDANTIDKLDWNIGEFGQGKLWFNVFGKD